MYQGKEHFHKQKETISKIEDAKLQYELHRKEGEKQRPPLSELNQTEKENKIYYMVPPKDQGTLLLENIVWGDEKTKAHYK